MSQTSTFSLQDAQGTSHVYECTRHRGSEGLPLAMLLGSLIVEPLAAAVGPVLTTTLESVSGQGDKGAVLEAVLDNPDALKALDLPGVARAVQAAMVALPESTVYSLLRYTNRDGKPLVDQGRPSETFERAYPGNYMELLKALWEVARWNGFFPALGTFLSAAKKAAGAGLGAAASGT